MGSNGEIDDILTGPDVCNLADKNGLSLLPNTLKEALGPKTTTYAGPGDPLKVSTDSAAAAALTSMKDTVPLSNPHFVDTNAIPWIINPDAPDIALKVMRVSAETGTVSMIVRQNGQAPPHYHLGPADFFITSGRIGYRAGPPEGFGPGTYFWEPAGARHESTQRVTDEHLIYTANVYGPIQFDEGVGTPVVAVQSWMQYLEAAKASNTPLIGSTFPSDKTTLLAPPMKPLSRL